MDKLKVLVVDDESRMRKLVHDFLVKSNFEVMLWDGSTDKHQLTKMQKGNVFHA